jgi:hypothetical protein
MAWWVFNALFVHWLQYYYYMHSAAYCVVSAFTFIWLVIVDLVG